MSLQSELALYYCKDIKGIETGNVLKSCDGCILEAVSIIEEYIFNNK